MSNYEFFMFTIELFKLPVALLLILCKLWVAQVLEINAIVGLLDIVSYDCITLDIQCRLTTHFLKKGDY